MALNLLYLCSVPLCPPLHLFLHWPWVFPGVSGSGILACTYTFQVLQTALVCLQVLAVVALVALNSAGIPDWPQIQWPSSWVSTGLLQCVCLLMSRSCDMCKANLWHFYMFNRLFFCCLLTLLFSIACGRKKEISTWNFGEIVWSPGYFWKPH